MKLNKIYNGDCLEVMKTFPDNSIDTILTDPPYHLTSIVKRFGKSNSAPAKYGTDGVFQRSSKGFMGKEWDGGNIAFTTELWKECLRVLKPGGTLLSFGGSRTYHRMACAVEDAGFILKDCIMWLYGSGFPKATDISKQLDKGVEREQEIEEIIQEENLFEKEKIIKKEKIRKDGSATGSIVTTGTGKLKKEYKQTKATTPEAKLWNGWKSHGLKPAYEPIIIAMKSNEGSYANNALKHGVAGLNIDGGRIPMKDRKEYLKKRNSFRGYDGKKTNWGVTQDTDMQIEASNIGRFPANIILDEEAAEQLGEPSRFFYVAKASKSERNAGCEEIDGNKHPTIKPLKLMEYLCTLTKTPTGGIVLDPFAGSGTTCMACKKTGRPFIGIEQDKEYCKIAEARIEATIVDNKLF